MKALKYGFIAAAVVGVLTIVTSCKSSSVSNYSVEKVNTVIRTSASIPLEIKFNSIIK